MLSIIVIAKAGAFTKDGINQFIADNIGMIQARDDEPGLLSSVQIAEKVIGDYEGVLLAATVEGDVEYSMPTSTLFIEVGEEFGIGVLHPSVNHFAQACECYGQATYIAHHDNINCVTFRIRCSAKVADMIMEDGNYTSMRLSK